MEDFAASGEPPETTASRYSAAAGNGMDAAVSEPGPATEPPSISPLRIGVLGAGRRGTALAHAAARLPNVRLAAVCDPDPERARTLARAWDCAHYTNWQTLLLFESLDAVIVASPSSIHAEQTLTALSQGQHVYVEKPPALDMAMAQRVADATVTSGKIVHVGFQHRYNSLVEPWRRALDGRAISLVHAHLYRGLPAEQRDVAPSLTGGQIVDEAIHLLDLCRWLVDEVTSVAAYAGTALWRERADWQGTDSAAISLQFAQGAAGTLCTTYAMPLAIPGHLALDVIADGPLLLRYTGADLQVAQESGVESWTVAEPPDYAAMAAFVEAVRTGDRSALRVSFDDAQRTLRLALACGEAAQKGTVVRLDGKGQRRTSRSAKRSEP